MKSSAPLPLLLITLGMLTTRLPAQPIHHAQGEMAGEVTQTSVILQSRLTGSAGLVDGDVPGAAGVGCFELSRHGSFRESFRTRWQQAVAENDFILKVRVDRLQPGTRYHYRLVFGEDAATAGPGPARSFKTLPDVTSATEVSFIVGNCMNYAFFHFGKQGNREEPGDGAYQGRDKHLGYPAFTAMRDLKPDFFVGAGDNVYYDHPVKGRAETIEQMRRKWHEQFVQPRLVGFFGATASYWLKDDHDYRKNDSDTTGDYLPSHETGIRIFREQVPIVDPNDPNAVTYRTHRVNKLLQVWMVENRDYRSPNRMEDGPAKTSGARSKGPGSSARSRPATRRSKFCSRPIR
jgi:alkaline phosphatase D